MLSVIGPLFFQFSKTSFCSNFRARCQKNFIFCLWEYNSSHISPFKNTSALFSKAPLNLPKGLSDNGQGRNSRYCICYGGGSDHLSDINPISVVVMRSMHDSYFKTEAR